jgi:hypothetical protein
MDLRWSVGLVAVALALAIEADAPLVGISTWARGVPVMSPEELYERLDQAFAPLLTP